MSPDVASVTRPARPAPAPSRLPFKPVTALTQATGATVRMTRWDVALWTGNVTCAASALAGATRLSVASSAIRAQSLIPSAYPHPAHGRRDQTHSPRDADAYSAPRRPPRCLEVPVAASR